MGGATGSAGGRRCYFTGRGRRCWKKKKPEGKGEWPVSVFGGEDDGEENGAGLREEEDAGTGWRGRRKMKACAGKGVRLEEENPKTWGAAPLEKKDRFRVSFFFCIFSDVSKIVPPLLS